MKIGLINVDNTKFPNIALGKIAMWHKMKRDDVEWYNALNHYDKVYLSKIFTFTPDVCYYVNADETIKGGTGYDIHSSLPEEIDMMQPDYSISVQSESDYTAMAKGYGSVDRPQGSVSIY